MRHILTLILEVLLLTALGTACASAPAAPVRMTPPAGKGGLAGQVTGASGQWTEGPLSVYAAAYFADQNSPGGVFSLDTDVCPQTVMLDGGDFQLNEIKPGRYVLVVGPNAEEARLVVDGQQKARVFDVVAGQILEVGQLKLAQ